MNSFERKEIRYQRRKNKREQNKLKAQKSYNEVFSPSNLYKAGKDSCSGVDWKTHVMNYKIFMLAETQKQYENLLNDKYKFNGFTHFRTIEHGKMRDINAITVGNRTIQRCYCNEIMTAAYSRTFVEDNCASLKGKGITYGFDKLKQHLREHYNLYGTNVVIYQYDFHNYFGSIPHDIAKDRLRQHIKDNKLADIGCKFIDESDQIKELETGFGIGLGSQINQNVALDFASPIDHYIQNVCAIKGYGRYMDDGYVINDSIENLKKIKNDVENIAKSMGMSLNPKKNKITPFKSHSFTFLKLRIRLQENGKITFEINRNSIKTMRRKLKLFRKWVDINKLSFKNVEDAYQSWRGYAKRHSSYKTIRNLDLLFIKLFHYELSRQSRKFKCYVAAIWSDELGWIYYESKYRLNKILSNWNKIKNNAYHDGFIPLIQQKDWQHQNQSKCASIFENLNESCLILS